MLTLVVWVLTIVMLVGVDHGGVGVDHCDVGGC